MRSALILSLLVALAWTAPVTQAEATCDLPPLTLPLFGGTPIAELATPSATPADAALTEEEAGEILEMYVACSNTGDPTLVWSMFSPKWFSDAFADSGEHYLPAFEYEISIGYSEVGEPLVLDSVHEIDLLDDGRMSVTATFSSGTSEWTDQLILANVDGQWLIDEVVLDSPPE